MVYPGISDVTGNGEKDGNIAWTLIDGAAALFLGNRKATLKNPDRDADTHITRMKKRLRTAYFAKSAVLSV